MPLQNNGQDLYSESWRQTKDKKKKKRKDMPRL